MELSDSHSMNTAVAHTPSLTEWKLQAKWLFYFDKIKNLGGLFIYDTTGISALPMLFFGAGDAGRKEAPAMGVPLAHVPVVQDA